MRFSSQSIFYEGKILIVKGESIERNVSLKEIFFSFLKLGATAYGGPAMVANIKDMAVGEKKWISEKEVLEGIALCQIIPGATAFQAASYVGYKLRGIKGAVAAAFAFTFPAFLLMLVLSSAYFSLRNIDIFQTAFIGMRAIVVGIIVNATLNIGRSAVDNWKGFLLSLLAFWLFFYKVNILWVIFISAVIGIFFYYSKETTNKEQKQLISESIDGKKNKFFLSASIIAGFVVVLIFFWCIKYISPVTSKLCFVLMKINVVAFGGAYSSLPLFQAEVVDKYGWVSTKEFIDGIAMGQITPGPIMITATFIGYKVYGLAGAVLATIAMFAPSFALLMFLSLQYERFRNFRFFQPMVKGILSSFVGMLGLMVYYFGKEAIVDLKTLVMTIASAVLIYFNVELFYIIPVGILISIVLF